MTEVDKYHQRTRSAFIWSRILRTPFWSIFLLLPYILYKDLHATPLQIGVVVALKPSVSLLSMYWSSLIKNRRSLLIPNVVWASILGLIPFFFFPFIDNPWFFIFSFGFFMTLHRGVVPAWMEIMKLNLPERSCQRIFAWGNAFSYLGEGLLPFFFGWILDDYFQAWRWIFPVAASVAVIPIFFQCRMYIPDDEKPEEIMPPMNWKIHILEPWKKAWKLLIVRPDFRAFQIGFMFGGMGLMFMQSVLPAYFIGVLNLTYTELGMALTFCKGIGFALTSEMWARWIARVDVYRFSGVVTLIAFLFPVMLIFAQYHIAWVYIAYIVYGAMQSGSELCWHLSGPIFAKKEDSTLYSTVNLIAGGLRGCFTPACSLYLCSLFSPALAIMVGGGFCLLATTTLFSYSRKFSAHSVSEIQ